MHPWLRCMHMMVCYSRRASHVLRAKWRSQPDRNIAVRILTALRSVTLSLSQSNSPSITTVHRTSVLFSSLMYMGLCFTGVPAHSGPLPIHGTVLLLFLLTEMTVPKVSFGVRTGKLWSIPKLNEKWSPVKTWIQDFGFLLQNFLLSSKIKLGATSSAYYMLY